MITTYVCEYCHCHDSNGFREPEPCLKHEAECDYNPVMKTCATCKHLDYSPDSDGDDNPFWCEIFKDKKHRRNCDKWETKLKPKAPNADISHAAKKK